MTKNLLLVLSAAVALAGCAAADTNGSSADPKEEVVYKTGSNIPTRQKAGTSDAVKTYDKDAAERARDEAMPSMRPVFPGAKPGGG